MPPHFKHDLISTFQHFKLNAYDFGYGLLFREIYIENGALVQCISAMARSWYAAYLDFICQLIVSEQSIPHTRMHNHLTCILISNEFVHYAFIDIVEIVGFASHSMVIPYSLEQE